VKKAIRLVHCLIVMLCVGTTTVYAYDAKALDLSQERCSVFIGSLCMVLPSDLSVIMDAPSDFQRFQFTRAGTVVAWAYVQNSPATIDGSPSFTAKTAGFRVEGFQATTSGTDRVDLVFAPAVKSSFAVHVYADVTGDLRQDVVRLLAGLRICDRPAPRTLTCPAESDLGPKIAKWLTN